MKKKWQKKSLLRILPALAFAFLPLTAIDEAALQLYLKKSDPLTHWSSIKIVSYQTPTEACSLIKNIYATEPQTQFFLLSNENCPSGPSTLQHTHLDSITNFSKLTGFQNYYFPYFHGKVFKTNTALELLNQVPAPIEHKKYWILLRDSGSDSSWNIKTPVGWQPVQVATTNWILSTLEKKNLDRSSLVLQIAISWILTAAAAWIVYSYPAALSLFLLIFLSTGYASVWLLQLHQNHWLLPLSNTLLSILAVYLLALNDRLDRRERREWILEVEAEKIRQVDELRNNFVSLVSHDLKTPVATLLSILQRLAAGEFGALSTHQTTALQKLERAGAQLQQTLATLILLGRVESGQLKPHAVPSDLNVILRESCEPFPQERIQHELEPLFLGEFDPILVREIAKNLIENAIKYSPTASTVIVRSGESDRCAELTPPQPGLWFEIQDFGPGIPLSDRGRVLQKFERGQETVATTDPTIKGTGLGLYLAHYFVKQQKGVLQIMSQTSTDQATPESSAAPYFSMNQTGTVVRVTLPLNPRYD